MSKLTLVHMPLSQLGHPSMALSVLAGECRQKGIATTVLYGNLRLASLCTLKKYLEFEQYRADFSFLGELVFKPYAGFTDAYTTEDYFDYMAAYVEKYGCSLELLAQARQVFEEVSNQADRLLEEMCDAVLATGCLAVGCDITYEQRNASLALFKRLKEKKPELITMLGGNSCTGSAGQALADYAPQVDYVFSGEADDVLVPVLELLEAKAGSAVINQKFPSVLIRGSEICSHARLNLEECAYPDFDDYFIELQKLGLQKRIHPCLLLEGSRGCWWGEKQRCNFCGIHTSPETIKYRQKSSARVVAELKYQAERYMIKSFVFTDCILSQTQVKELPLVLSKEDGFHLFAEVKSNLTASQLRGLRKAGFVMLQPGIESFQDDLLCLMHKGNSAIKHLELLKNSRIYGVTLLWNILTRMPGDKPDYYRQMNVLIPWLTHLQPPLAVGRIIFQRNSCYTQNAAQYGLQLRSIEPYRLIGNFGDDFLQRSAEYFENVAPGRILSKEMQAVLDELAAKREFWLQAFKYSFGDRLTVKVKQGRWEVWDLRKKAPEAFYILPEMEQKILAATEEVVTFGSLPQRVPDATAEELEKAVADLEDRHLVVRIGNQLLSLVTTSLETYQEELLLPVGYIT